MRITEVRIILSCAEGDEERDNKIFEYVEPEWSTGGDKLFPRDIKLINAVQELIKTHNIDQRKPRERDSGEKNKTTTNN